MSEKSKEKALEKERKHKPSEMGSQGAVESPKQKETDVKTKQHKADAPGMMERGKSEMMDRGKSEMMDRGKSQMMERTRPEQEKSEKKSPGNVGVPLGSSQTDEKTR